MRRCIMTILFTAVLATGARAEEKPEGCQGGKGACGQVCKLMRGATVSVKNTDNGVVVTITSDDAEAVRKIQACWAAKAAKKAGEAKDPVPAKHAHGAGCGHDHGKKADAPKKDGDWEPETVTIPRDGKAPQCDHDHGHEGRQH